MKYLKYMAAHPEENMDFCKPYVTSDGDHFLLVYDGETDAVKAPEYEGHRFDGTLGTVLEQFARDVNPDYDLYEGWTDDHVALEVMHETGCAACPWRHECQAMAFEIDDALTEEEG